MATNDKDVAEAPLAARQAAVVPPAHTDCHGPATPLKCPATGAAASTRALIVGSGSNQSAVDLYTPSRPRCSS
jgi:hypothetical protein